MRSVAIQMRLDLRLADCSDAMDQRGSSADVTLCDSDSERELR